MKSILAVALELLVLLLCYCSGSRNYLFCWTQTWIVDFDPYRTTCTTPYKITCPTNTIMSSSSTSFSLFLFLFCFWIRHPFILSTSTGSSNLSASGKARGNYLHHTSIQRMCNSKPSWYYRGRRRLLVLPILLLLHHVRGAVRIGRTPP